MSRIHLTVIKLCDASSNRLRVNPIAELVSTKLTQATTLHPCPLVGSGAKNYNFHIIFIIFVVFFSRNNKTADTTVGGGGGWNLFTFYNNFIRRRYFIMLASVGGLSRANSM